MLSKRIDLWEEGEYGYQAAFGFCPNLVSYLHEDEMVRPCIIVVPGGGYEYVAPPEGEIVAKEFYEKGYQTFVLTYTVNVAGVPVGRQPMNDLSRAIRCVRRFAEEFHVQNDRVAVCGFSAGGHLCGSVCTHFMDIEETNEAYRKYPNRPDAAILSYPVITAGGFAHRDSFRALLGADATKEEYEYMSLEKHVTSDTPPCFLWHTANDGLVPVENSYLFADALKAADVTFACHIFSDGHHGLSLANEAWAKGEYGDIYTVEQTENFVKSVKNGGFPCDDEAKRALLDAFDFGNPDRVNDQIVEEVNEEVSIWPVLADAWLRCIWKRQ